MDSKSYDELHGSNNWDGLLDPLDHSLRSLILSYGDLCSAAERAFNDDQGSKYCGYCHYGKSSFFKGLMLPWAESKFKVTSFIYATSSIELSLLIPRMPRKADSAFDSNWMGYIAVSNDEYSKSIGRREICVVWRGTVRLYEWMDDILGATPVPAEPLVPLPPVTLTGDEVKNIPQIMAGWLIIYNTSDPNSEFLKTSARTQLLGRINELLIKYKNEKVSITCTGHSLGACLATLSAVDLAANVATPGVNVSAFVFESPQVGNEAFKSKMEEMGNLKVLRVKNVPDIIPFWPSKLLKWVNEKHWVTVPSDLLEYVDVGIEILIDTKKSPYLKQENGLNGMLHPMVFHNLEGVLHTLSGWTGMNGEFDWSLEKRDLGLVNMSTDYLKEELKIPGTWWGEKNKGMVLNDDGHWVLSPIDPNDQDLPVY
ncbi:phospholipase A1-IIdelta [Lactuca sativa]|uniref:Phospholipase A1 n=1 Tax=Lactuca sativa TaxID=4236 RepID=A0A9R1WT87_LACSA|nr:phospholipase A1-IIdelta [Lactuca sativa]KAJ0228341.1 hypothetical protein LSAT_V11C100010160 [Lactuca sativa]